jgi:ATP-binding cassette subfamily A (ABC1) protein 5
MEEADTLCTRIGIMVAGKLRALGTQQHLKTVYGTGFKLDITVKPGAAPPDAFVSSVLDGDQDSAVRGVQVGSTVTYSFRKASSFDPVKALVALQQLSNSPVDHGISDWSLAQPSLEEVFVNIATKFQKSPTASI